MSNWQIDPVHSAVGFAVRHMMISTVRGRFGRFEGQVEFDPSRPADSRVEVTIEAASMDTDSAQRDDHLRSADFLDAAGYPHIVFRSTSVEPVGEDRARIRGELTIRGVTRPVVLEATHVATITGMQGEQRAAFEASTRIDREEWGLVWNVALEKGGWLVGKEIEIGLEVTLVEMAAGERSPRESAQAA